MVRYRTATLTMYERVLAELATSGDLGQDAKEIAERTGFGERWVLEALGLLRVEGKIELADERQATADVHGDPIDGDQDITTRLASGKTWHPFAPRPEDFEWSDVAAGVARTCRFNGQLPENGAAGFGEIYSVAQHLCLCSDLLDEHWPEAPIEIKIALHVHDGEEGLNGIGDVVGPVKHARRLEILTPYFRAIEDAVARKAGIDPDVMRSPEVKRFDKMAYAIENWHLRGLAKGDVPQPPEKGPWFDGFVCWSPETARRWWMARLDLLLRRA